MFSATASNQPSAAAGAAELIQIVKTRFVRPDGLLARSFPPDHRTLFNHFDDIAPFFIFFGETDFLLRQLHMLRQQGRDLVQICGDRGVVVTRDIDEWFGGLYSVYAATRDQETRRLLSDSVEFVLRWLCTDGYLSAAFYPRTGRRASFYEPWSGGLLESFCEMRAEFPEAFARSQSVLRRWISDTYFEQHGLFPYRVFQFPALRLIQRAIVARVQPSSPPARPAPGDLSARQRLTACVRLWTTNGWYSQLMKSNSTPAFALLAFYRATHEPEWLELFERWLDNAMRRFCSKGRVFAEYFPCLHTARNPAATPAFILVDAICDGAATSGGLRRHLPQARRILDHYWDTRLSNGLVPLREGAPVAHLDTQIDFGVSMRRYAELTGDLAYRDRGIALTQRALEEHYTPDGYLTYSGDRVPSQVIDPKYNALALKGFANLLTADRPIYWELHDLFKDR